MNKAIDNLTFGNQIEVEAPIGVSVPARSGRYKCPCCLESVALDVRGFFRHKNRTEQSIECENRVSSNSESIYERMGVPLFIKEYSLKEFELFLGFPCVSRTIQIFDDDTITIYNSRGYKEKYSVKSRFSNETNTLIRVNYSCGYKGYSFEFNKGISTAFTSLITTHSDRVGNGAFFKCSNEVSRKVRFGGTIALDTDYYFIGDVNRLNSRRNVDVTYCGTISFLDKRESVYKVFIRSSNMTHEDYSQLSNLFSSFYKLNLVSRDSQLVPIWPPAITNDSRVIFNKSHNPVRFIVDSPNDNPKVFRFNQRTYEEIVLKDRNSLFELDVDAEPKYLSVDKAYNGNIQTVTRRNFSAVVAEYEYSYINEFGELLSLTDSFSPKKAIKICTNFSGFAVVKKHDGSNTISTINDSKGITISNLADGDIIELYSRNWNLIDKKRIENADKKLNLNNGFKTVRLLRTLNGPMVSIDSKAISVFRKVGRESLVYAFVRRYISQGQYPTKALDIIANYIRGNNHE